MKHLPRGWHNSQFAARNFRDGEDRPVECNNCNWKGLESDLKATINMCDLNDRLTPGDSVPVGECNSCGAFVYYSDILTAYKAVPTILEALAECAPKSSVKKVGRIRSKDGGRNAAR